MKRKQKHSEDPFEASPSLDKLDNALRQCVIAHVKKYPDTLSGDAIVYALIFAAVGVARGDDDDSEVLEMISSFVNQVVRTTPLCK